MPLKLPFTFSSKYCLCDKGAKTISKFRKSFSKIALKWEQSIGKCYFEFFSDNKFLFCSVYKHKILKALKAHFCY